jgi:hypothetical protein
MDGNVLKGAILTQSLAPDTANVAKAGRYHSFTIILKFIRTRTGPHIKLRQQQYCKRKRADGKPLLKIQNKLICFFTKIQK